MSDQLATANCTFFFLEIAIHALRNFRLDTVNFDRTPERWISSPPTAHTDDADLEACF